MRFLPQWLAQLIGDAQFEATVERIVGRIENPLWNKIISGEHVMSSFEARGYVRARSMVLVSDQIAREIPASTPDKHINRLRVAVLEQLMSKMTQRLADHPIEQTLRRAA